MSNLIREKFIPQELIIAICLSIDQHMATCRGNVESIGFSQVLNLALKGKRSIDMIIYDVTYGPSCLLHIAHLFGRIPIVGITSSSLTSDILKINQNSVLNAALDRSRLDTNNDNMTWYFVLTQEILVFDAMLFIILIG